MVDCPESELQLGPSFRDRVRLRRVGPAGDRDSGQWHQGGRQSLEAGGVADNCGRNDAGCLMSETDPAGVEKPRAGAKGESSAGAVLAVLAAYVLFRWAAAVLRLPERTPAWILWVVFVI